MKSSSSYTCYKMKISHINQTTLIQYNTYKHLFVCVSECGPSTTTLRRKIKLNYIALQNIVRDKILSFPKSPSLLKATHLFQH